MSENFDESFIPIAPIAGTAIASLIAIADAPMLARLPQSMLSLSSPPPRAVINLEDEPLRPSPRLAAQYFAPQAIDLDSNDQMPEEVDSSWLDEAKFLPSRTRDHRGQGSSWTGIIAVSWHGSWRSRSPFGSQVKDAFYSATRSTPDTNGTARSPCRSLR